MSCRIVMDEEAMIRSAAEASRPDWRSRIVVARHSTECRASRIVFSTHPNVRRWPRENSGDEPVVVILTFWFPKLSWHVAGVIVGEFPAPPATALVIRRVSSPRRRRASK